MQRRIFWGAAVVAFVMLVIGVLAVGAISRSAAAEARDDLFRQAEVTARLLAQQLGNATDAPSLRELGQRTIELTEIARQVGGHDYVEAAIVVDGELRALGPNDVIISRLEPGLPDRQITSVNVRGTEVSVVIRQVDINRPVPLLVVIGRDTVPLGASGLLRPIVLALVAGAGLTLLLAGYLARQTARRLDALTAATRAFAAGDFSARAPEDGDDEVAAVAATFNEMGAQLDHARRRERDFLMSVGHDLRTPLTTIRGYAEAIQAGHVPEDDLPRVAGVLHTQAGRLSRLVEDLMLLSRLEAREFTLRPEPVDLRAHLKEIAEAFRGRADAAHVRLTTDLADVGDVITDADRVGQVLGNLIENALRYTPESGEVTIGLHRGDGDRLVVRVADSGPGIDSSDLPHLFERLYVAQRYRAVRPEGSGLGLTIVKELVDVLGGQVTVESEIGRGTIVSVSFPVSIGQGSGAD